MLQAGAVEHGDLAHGAKKIRLRSLALRVLGRLAPYWRQAMQLLASAAQHPRLRWVRKPSLAMPMSIRQESPAQERLARSPSRELLTLPLLVTRVRVLLAWSRPAERLIYLLRDLQELVLSERWLPRAAQQLRLRALEVPRHLARLQSQALLIWRSLWPRLRAVWDRLQLQADRMLRSQGLPEQEKSRASSSGVLSTPAKTQVGARHQHHKPRLGRALAQVKILTGAKYQHHKHRLGRALAQAKTRTGKR